MWPEKDKPPSFGGISSGGAVSLMLMGLKLGGAIDMEWKWVFAPLWAPILIAIPIIIIAYINRWKGY